MDTRAEYDISGLVAFSKRSLWKFIGGEALYGTLLVLSILAIIFYGSYIAVFIIGVLLACASAFLCGRLIRNFAFSDYSSASGEIADIHKEVRIIHTTKVGGINLFGVRKYDQDGKYEIRLGVFIKDGERMHGYFLNDVTEDHTKYYEAKGHAIHIWGTRFPVIPEADTDKWLCPACGAFNSEQQKTCAACKRKILK